MPGPISALSLVREKKRKQHKIKAVAWAVTHSWNDGCFILLFVVYGRSNQSVSASSCCTLVSLEQHKWPSFVVVVCSEACTVCQPTLLSAHTQILSALWNRRARNQLLGSAPWSWTIAYRHASFSLSFLPWNLHWAAGGIMVTQCTIVQAVIFFLIGPWLAPLPVSIYIQAR